jgi:hypothetical protein
VVSLAFRVHGVAGAEKPLGISSTVVVLSLLAFAANIWKNAR